MLKERQSVDEVKETLDCFMRQQYTLKAKRQLEKVVRELLVTKYIFNPPYIITNFSLGCFKMYLYEQKPRKEGYDFRYYLLDEKIILKDGRIYCHSNSEESNVKLLCNTRKLARSILDY